MSSYEDPASAGTPGPGTEASHVWADDVQQDAEYEQSEIVTALGDPSSVAVAYAASVGSYGNGYAGVSVRKFDNFVVITGTLVVSAAFAAGVALFTLPAGYQPSGDVVITGWIGADTVARCTVRTDGTVTCQTALASGNTLSVTGVISLT